MSEKEAYACPNCGTATLEPPSWDQQGVVMECLCGAKWAWEWETSADSESSGFHLESK